jgi:Protein of unknown function (DUF3089)
MHPLQKRCAYFLLLMYLTGCTPQYAKFTSQYQTNAAGNLPDYGNLYYWAAHPLKKDPSDSIPLPLKDTYAADSSADVFFLYPTTLTDQNDLRWNADINDAALNAKTDYSPILYQSSAFNIYRIFSPRYRQAHIRAYFSADTARALAAFDTAYADIKLAFEYYLQHYNNGRPIIIASHSQGSTHAQRLLKEYFDNKPLQKQLVVAYILGMYIPPSQFAGIKICSDSLQTGCICAWRTLKKDYLPDFVIKEKETCLVNNPLTWTTGNSYAANTLNEGSVLLNFNKIKKHVTGAVIHDGVLWIGRLHMSGGLLVRRKNFHVGDINIFYLNIRRDVQRRVRTYLSYPPATPPAP